MLTIFVEPTCDQFDVPVNGEAIVRLADGPPHSIDVSEGWVTVWDEDCSARVEVVTEQDRDIDDALMLAQIWLRKFGAENEASLLDKIVDDLETKAGYYPARAQVFDAFYAGFSNEGQRRSDDAGRHDGALEFCYRAGVSAAKLNRVAKEKNSFPELDAAPLETDTVRAAFSRALTRIR